MGLYGNYADSRDRIDPRPRAEVLDRYEIYEFKMSLLMSMKLFGSDLTAERLRQDVVLYPCYLRRVVFV